MKTNTEVSKALADICDSLMTELSAKGFKRDEAIDITCAVLSRANVSINNLPPFMAGSETMQ